MAEEEIFMRRQLSEAERRKFSVYFVTIRGYRITGKWTAMLQCNPKKMGWVTYCLLVQSLQICFPKWSLDKGTEIICSFLPAPKSFIGSQEEEAEREEE